MVADHADRIHLGASLLEMARDSVSGYGLVVAVSCSSSTAAISDGREMGNEQAAQGEELAAAIGGLQTLGVGSF